MVVFDCRIMAFTATRRPKPPETRNMLNPLPAALVAASVALGGPESAEAPAPSAYVLNHTMKNIDGIDTDLAQFKGKVVLMVNVASECGYTQQYKGLQKLFAEKKDQGFVVLGFPANEFGGQEPGSNADIKAFCTGTFEVTFPMFSKISVKGANQHPLYKQIAAQPAPIGGDPKWNFTKFLIDKSGNVVNRYEPSTAPDDAKLRARIEELLAAK